MVLASVVIPINDMGDLWNSYSPAIVIAEKSKSPIE
jgi:hypothetical protein